MLFRRNSKEVTSEPTRWHSDHMAVWNQHVGIQTSLLLNKKAMQAGSTALEFLKKEYEVVLVAVGPALVRAPGCRECASVTHCAGFHAISFAAAICFPLRVR